MKVILFILVVLFHLGCSSKQLRTVEPRLDNEMPKKILWAWERPEDLRFIDPSEFGVAFLAQTIYLENDRVLPKPRRQPFEVPDGTYLIAVTRVETNKDSSKRPTLDGAMAKRLAGLILKSRELPNVRGLQVDFDAVVSERGFYRTLMFDLRKELDAQNTKVESQNSNSDTHHSSFVIHQSLTMTSLASWCAGDTWFNDFPVDEAVPMVFVMGADQESIRNFLRNNNDWREPLCRGSYGISIDEPKLEGLKPSRRMYYFKNTAWNAADLESLR